nr:MAG TPA: hypothetical protein [Caudoviricetes sp.]DAW92118.1 MAG TPA: hypothetical protein [Bacteriophage sp.]
MQTRVSQQMFTSGIKEKDFPINRELFLYLRESII